MKKLVGENDEDDFENDDEESEFELEYDDYSDEDDIDFENETDDDYEDDTVNESVTKLNVFGKHLVIVKNLMTLPVKNRRR